MANEADLRRHFEAILGREFVDISDGEVQLRESTGLYSTEEGHDTSREIGTTGQTTKGCGIGQLFSIGGLAVTGADGKVEFLVSEYHCITGTENRLLPRHPIIFVATVQARDPVFATSGAYLVRNEDGIPDVRIEIYTWEPGGVPAASKLVKWFCRFPTDPAIF